MALSGIISVSGLPGLHKVISQTKNGLIVESLVDGRRRPIYSTQKVSSLEDISIYTIEDDVPLEDVFKRMSEKEGGKAALNHKTDPKQLREYLTEVLEEVDHERVYNSDIAKLFQWYNMLTEKDLLTFEEEEEEKEENKAEKAEDKPKETKEKKAKTGATKSKTSKKSE